MPPVLPETTISEKQRDALAVQPERPRFLQRHRKDTTDERSRESA